MTFKNVFVVDDDKISQFLVKKLLISSGVDANPSFFENGFDAINNLKKFIDCIECLPDLILLDINMPVVDGWQFLEEFKMLKQKLTKNIEIYIISSSDNSLDRLRAVDFKEEIRDYLLKPITEESIKTMFSV